MTAPHVGEAPVLRRGGVWVPGDLLDTAQGRVQRGPLWADWLAPVAPTSAVPLVLVHGGGGQGTDWLLTPDGRPGWAAALAVVGHPVYVVDRPGHGRSAFHPDVLGTPGPLMPVEATAAVFAPSDRAAEQTAWPWGRAVDDPEIARLAASGGFLPADLGAGQELDARRLVELLELVGPSVLVTHSAGAPAGWLAAAARPDLVRAVVAVEPMGPPYVEIPSIGALSEGLTSVPLDGDGLNGMPVLLVWGEASPFAGAMRPIAEHLTGLGAEPELLDLGATGIRGNGHGLIFEANSDRTVQPVDEWIGKVAS